MSEYDDNEIDEGASLALALEAVRQQSDQWQKYKNLKEEIIDFEQREAARIERQSQSFSQPVIHSHSNMPGFTVRNIRLGIGRQKAKLENLESCFIKKLADLLEAGQFIAFGKVGGFSEPFRLIEPNYWQGMNIVNFERSIVRERTQAQTEWLEVRIFAKGEEPQPIDAPAISTRNSEIDTPSLNGNKLGSIDACIMDYYENNKSDFDQVNSREHTKIWLANNIAKKYDLKADSVDRSLRDKTKSPLHTEY